MAAKELLDVVGATKYPLEAFLFVQKGLEYTVRRVHGRRKKGKEEPPAQHVTGQELCHGLRDYAIQQYGLLARPVLKHWRIHCCEDFGRIVFALVESEIMHKTDSDTIEDFAGVYDFAEAFSPQLQLSENL